MDTRQLKYVIEIAKCGSISKASENLFISQSGLNQQLLRIEKELGVKLFDRDTHHLELTEAGAFFVQYAKEAVNREEQMNVMLQDAAEGSIGEIHINLAMELGIDLLAHIFEDFHRQYPLIDLKIEDHIVYDQYRLLLDHRLDIGMVMIKQEEIDELEYVHLTTERFLLAVNKEHPLAAFYVPTEDGDYPVMDLALCKEEPFALMFAGSTYRQVVDPLFLNAGFKPNIMFEARSNHVSAHMALKGICLTILPESQLKLYPDLCFFRLEDNPTWDGCLIYHKEQQLRKAARYFIELAVKAAPKIMGPSRPVWNSLISK